MSENEQHRDINTFMENSAVPATKESSMKHGWCQTINNAVYYYQTLFSIALILEQVSNYNNLLREQMNMEKDTCMKQKNAISDENSFVLKLCATANECTPGGFEEKIKIMKGK